MHLSLEQQIVCRRDLELLELCIKDTEHRFYREMLINAMQTAILDFSIFMLVSMMKATFQRRCLHHTSFLENAGGWYIREHREVSYYVDCLCITSKYLSEVLKKVSRYAANYWINRYTIFDISRLLRDKSLSFVQISDMFSFSSQAYLSRYVQQNLGFNPTEYRT